MTAGKLFLYHPLGWREGGRRNHPFGSFRFLSSSNLCRRRRTPIAFAFFSFLSLSFTYNTFILDIMNMCASENNVSQTPPQIQRLIDWNADVLLKLLKRIVAKRQAQGKEGWINDNDDPVIDYGETVLDEVADVIKMPGFERHRGPVSADVPPQVADQLRDFVSQVCLAHRNHPMHSLQHSSHVTMAISKLIARISVVESELDEQGTNEQMSDDAVDSLGTHLHNHTFGITSDPLIQFSAVLSALVHAVDHRGISNEDLVLEEPDEAKKFKFKSMTEQRSIQKAWARLMSHEFVQLRQSIYADKEEKQRFRQIFVNSVMATDIMDEEMQAARMKRWEENFGPRATHDVDIDRKATIVLECLMQSSDIFHTMQNWHVFLKWTEREFEEENKAYKEGRIKENPVDTMYKNNLRFLDNYVIPLAMQLKDIDAFVVNSDEYLNFALKNRQGWSSSGQEIVAAFNDKYNGPKESVVSATINLARVMVDEDGEPLPGQEEPEKLPRHVQRLVDWNCEVLEHLLKQILAKRQAAGKATDGGAPEFKGELGKPIIDEVTDVIHFEKFDEATSSDKLQPEKVELSTPVLFQLRDYVVNISKQYRDHPYHCIDKGSHMCMLMNKLLSRMVADQQDATGGSAADLHKKTHGLVSDPLAQFAATFQALVHDVQHPVSSFTLPS